VYSEIVENNELVAKTHSMWFVSLRALRVSVFDRDVMIASSSGGILTEAMLFCYGGYQFLLEKMVSDLLINLPFLARPDADVVWRYF
jgi:hypothetical protein